MELVSSSRIQQIVSRSDGLELRRYELTYSDSLALNGSPGLTQIREYNGSHCFAPTQFSWYPSSPQLGSTGTNAGQLPNADDVKQLQLADINNDGIVDMLWLEERSGTLPPLIRYRMGQLSSLGSVTYSGAFIGPQMHSRVMFDHDNELPSILVFDVDGDGDNDILYAVHDVANPSSPGNKTFQAHFWNQASGSSGSFSGPMQVGTFFSGARKLAAVDWDGDGLVDLVHHDKRETAFGGISGGEVGTVRVSRNRSMEPGGTGTSRFQEESVGIVIDPAHVPVGNPGEQRVFSLHPNRVFDANGDGRADLVFRVWLRTCYWNCPILQGGGGVPDQSAQTSLPARAPRPLAGPGRLRQGPPSTSLNRPSTPPRSRR